MSTVGASASRHVPPLDHCSELQFPNSVYLVWEDLTVVLPDYGKGPTRRLIQGLSGCCEPGRIMAIMGPSGSGKSILLDSLAGRLAGNAYVTQENVLLGTLTVRETVTYSAQLRLPANMRKDQIREAVESTLAEMGLQDCADRTIGNWHLRGISSGEKKRLCIAIEILTHPHLLFLDEPTSGLDTASAFFVTQMLRNMAYGGRTIISSIHQPSSEVFSLFDDLILLSNGENVYFGEAKLATEFFAEVGGSLRIRSREREASTDPLSRMGTSQIRAMLVEKYKSSEYATEARRRIREVSLIEGLDIEWSEGSQASWWMQLFTLTRRSFVNMSRDLGYYWVRIIIYIMVSLCVGTLYFEARTSYSAILARVSCGAFVGGFMTFMSIGGFPSLIEEMKVFYHERLNRHYGVAVFILSNYLSSFPFLVAVAGTSGTITYFMVKFHSDFSHYAYIVLNLFSGIAVIESLMMIVASLVPNFLMGIITGVGIVGIIMLTSGFFRRLPDIPKPFWRYPMSYISYGSWSLQGLYKNDMIGVEFDPLIPGGPKLKGEEVIQKIFGINLGHSKWWDLAAVFAILFSYRLLFFLILKFNERASPLFHAFYAKQTLRHLKRKPSFRMKPSFSYFIQDETFLLLHHRAPFFPSYIFSF
ncbi:hypothetical protein AAC387_Pa10g1291 [Persea americana]